ncbi:hypothetical protein ACELLULO517_08490 [Acidisoma cellulosilytica]|uniref:Yip1 domain-containing protein n=1 Tax=Acidisoma cellulosilyticum TaxID=2802395 RepID=A0A963YZW1_9PROT|nr:hypothetical protein [Acidisoma cellulosilyticum]MCB8880267.1 hypothetical protein [Acidisoma cellulosilyticum]
MSDGAKQGLRLWAQEIALSARGIAMLTFGRPEGARSFTNDLSATRRSFITALFAFPIFVLFHYMDWLAGTGPLESTHALILDLLSYPISWAGYALIAVPLLRMLGLEAMWPRFIAAWNWSNLAQYVLLMLTSVPLLLHAPSILSETAALVGYGWALWLEWWTARLVLGLSPSGAALLVLVDVAFSAIVSLITLYPFPGFSLG